MKSKLVSILLLLFIGWLLNGQCDYNTIASGDYFNAQNWSNGLIPPNPIPNELTVTLSHSMSVGGSLENNGFLNGITLTILNSGSYGGNGTFTGSLINMGTVTPGHYASGTITNSLAGLTTTNVTAILPNGATTGGIICYDGGSIVSARGVCYGTNPSPDINGLKTIDGNGLGIYSSILTALNPATTYYVRGYATNSLGTSYGQEITFETLTVPAFNCGDTLFYEGQTYTTKLMPNGKCWIVENINVGTLINGAINQTNNSVLEKYCYNNVATNCNAYGGVYQWGEAVQYFNGASNTNSPSPPFMGNVQGICPIGWHIPSNLEFTELENSLPSPDKGSRLAGNEDLWTDGALEVSTVFGTSGFEALPVGYRSTLGSFINQSIVAIVWSSSENVSSNAWIIGLNFNDTGVGQSIGDKAHGFSVRCIKD